MSGLLLVADYSSSSDEDTNESPAKCVKLGGSGIKQFKRFIVVFDSLNVYCNDDKTRTFLSLKVGHTGSPDLEKIVTKVDHSLREFNLQSFYEDPSFHISLLWCIGDKRTELEAILPSLEIILSDISDNVPLEEDSFCNQLIDRVMCKSGNKIFCFTLK